jgi:hypothetical protein
MAGKTNRRTQSNKPTGPSAARKSNPPSAATVAPPTGALFLVKGTVRSSDNGLLAPVVSRYRRLGSRIWHRDSRSRIGIRLARRQESRPDLIQYHVD